MKNIIFLTTILLSHLSWAQAICVPESKEMSQYFAQQKWQPETLKDPSGVPAINGFVDAGNNFRFSEMTRGGSYAANLSVDPTNVSYEDFFSYCANAKSKGTYLRSMRRSQEGNKYLLSLRYLPEIKNVTNNPLKDQNFKTTHSELQLRFASDSLVDTNDFDPRGLKEEVYKLLSQQMAKQGDLGVLNFDLTGYDDVVCDLVQGKASLIVKQTAISDAPLVVQTKEVEPSDIETVYRSLQESTSPSFSREMNLYVAGRISAQLEEQRKTSPLSAKKSFALLAKLMDPGLSELKKLDGSALRCIGEQMQSYSKSVDTHFFNIGFKFSSLDQIKAKGGGQ